ncbi:MAG: flavodoxin [Prolixibacteraceae bacterium]|jgi:flavodoxin I|nr:flavodoxin [Prolixibacteraceae bacterium]MDI9563112.1 flavodoxin [Bacteroidota bacterium]NLT00585.1 flavodoxin [Bacteroidales bacterium]OQB78900.1 MAG: Flavodoxin [Bacteroidetes bacterium ADurb.Bin123]HNU77934.1 flavodoxin [Prolixibacteraceae bacterium]
MKKTAIFFGPEKGSVNRVADRIRDIIGHDKVEMVPVRNATAADFDRFDRIIFGISTVGKETWDGKPAKSDWGRFMPEVSRGNFAGKKVAIFGLGDHITYASNFVDFMGLLARELNKAGAEIFGKVSPDGYEFEESQALVDNLFVGLPLDEDFEPEKTEERLQNWIKALKTDFGL